MTTLLTLEDEIFNQLALQQDLDGAEEPSVYNPLSDVERKKSQGIALATDLPVDQVEAERAVGDNTAETAARTQGLNFDYALTINKAIEDGLEPEEVAEIIEQRTAKGEDMTLGEYMLMQNLMLGDNGVNAYAARTMTNMETWNDLMQQAFEDNDQSGFSKVVTFLDVNILRELTIGAFENVTFRSNREGTEIREAFNTLKPDEFKEWAKEYIKERASEGIFTEDSIWNLFKAANDATYLGDDPMAGLNAAFGAADIATLGATKLAKAGLSSTGKLLSLSKARRPIDAVAVIDGEVPAAVAATKLVDDAGVQTDEIMAGRMLPEDLDPASGPMARPSGVEVRNGTRKNIITEKLEQINRQGSFGEYIPRAVIEGRATDIAARIADSLNDVVVSTRSVIDEGSDDFKVIVRMGKEGSGAPFRRKVDAEDIAAQDPSLRVVKREEGRGWFVETEQRINVLGLPGQAEALAKGTFVGDAINKVFGAATLRLGDKLGAKFMQAEAGQALISELFKPYQKTIRAVRGKELENLSDFFEQLRDGDLSHMRQAPTRESFQSMYKTMYKTTPSNKVLDAYEAVQDINDATWQIKSSERLKRIVAEGGIYADFTDTFGDVVYRVDGQKVRIPDDELILDLKTGRSLRKEELGPDQVSFKVPETHLDHLYVTNVKSTRVLERVDVMPYNVGGPRTNAEFRWFVGLTKEQTLVSGNKISGGFKTMLGSFGKDQAVLARTELNNISTKVRELLSANGVKDIKELVLTKAEYDELGDVIRNNNTWRKHTTDLEDLQKLSQQYKVNFSEDFVFKARDEKVSVEEAGENVANVGSTFGEVVGSRLNMKRGDNVLMEFGGKKAANANPISAIADQFGSETFGYANRAASQNALVGWVKLAEKAGGVVEFPAGVPTNDYLNRFLGAKVTNTGKFNDIAAQLREQQDVIKRRLNQSTWLSDKWDTFTASATEAVFGVTGKKVDFTKTDPGSQLLRVGFYSKFGFFNPDQFVLQGLHALTIVGISPVQGTKGIGLTVPMLAIASITNPATRKLAIERLAKGTGLELDEINTLVRYIDESGRNIVDNQVIELQAPQKFGAASNLTGKAVEGVNYFLDKSTIFFKEGERASRMTGIITAFLEHRAKRPGIDPLSPEGKTWITNREQDLTFRMTTQSRNFAQSGPMRVPTQWLSFTIRAMENIAVGRNFTAGERVRMALVMGPMFGLTGLGAGKMTGYITESLGYDPEDTESVKMFNRIKYGLVDAVLSNLLGTETAYAQRVAPLGQVQDTYRKLFEDDLFTTLFGPSGEIGGDMLTVGLSGVKAMVGGNPGMARDDLTQLLRNLSTFDKGFKIRELVETGNYRSKTHKLAVSGLDPNAAFGVFFGATPAPVQNYYDIREMIYKENQEYKEFANYQKQKATLALSLLTQGDKDDMLRGTKLWEEINDEVWSSRFSNQLKNSLQRSLVNVAVVPDIMRNAMRLGLQYDAELFRTQTQ